MKSQIKEVIKNLKRIRSAAIMDRALTDDPNRKGYGSGCNKTAAWCIRALEKALDESER